MSNGNILFIDNDAMFLETRTIYLNRAGYKVFPAHTLEEADNQLKSHFVQLIIIDVRAIDDNDIHDKSGIEFARRPEYARIPKIILTAEPSLEDSRKVLVGSSTSNWIIAAQDYLPKEDGAEEMVRVVERIFNDHVALNRELEISWKQLNAIELLGKIEPELGGEEIAERLSELDALFRTLFGKFEYVTISQILTGVKKSPKLLAYAQTGNGNVGKYFIEIGRSSAIESTIKKYDSAITYNRFESGVYITEKSLEGTTPRYGAIGWTFRGIGPSQYFVTFKTMIRNRPQVFIEQTMKHLFENAVSLWQCVSNTEPVRLIDLFWQNQDMNDFAVDLLTTTARMIEQEAEKFGMNDLSVSSDGYLHFQFSHFDGSETEEHQPHHLDKLVQKVAEKSVELTLKKGVIHNNLGSESIFFDHDGRGWLTGFDQTQVDEFLLVDAIKFAQNLRASWSAHISPADWYQFETATLKLKGTTDERLETDNPFWGKMQAILGEIQTYAETTDELIGDDYLMGLFWANVEKLSQLSQYHLRACDEVQGAINLLSSTMLIGRALIAEPQPHSVSIKIDYANRSVQVGSKIIELTPQEHSLLCYLRDYANQAVTRLDLANNVFGANYEIAPSEKNFIEYNRITMTLKRLREKIDEDGSLGLISTVRGKGYRLNLPEDRI